MGPQQEREGGKRWEVIYERKGKVVWWVWWMASKRKRREEWGAACVFSTSLSDTHLCWEDVRTHPIEHRSACATSAVSLRTSGGLTDYLSRSRLEGSLALSIPLPTLFFVNHSLIPLCSAQGHCNAADVWKVHVPGSQGWVSTSLLSASLARARVWTSSCSLTYLL